MKSGVPSAMKVFQFNIGGGEPFIRPDFLDLALAYALINFIGVLAVLEFFRSRAERRAADRAAGG